MVLSILNPILRAMRNPRFWLVVVLFVVGAVKARMTIGHPGKSGLEMAVIGTVSALVGYAVGALLKIPATP